MCTLVLAYHRAELENKILLVTNRDEFLARPASAPKVRPFGTLRALAPQDELAGGTWVGANEGGLVAAITNRYMPVRKKAPRSRGEIVNRALSHESVPALVEEIAALPLALFNPFHLVVAEDQQAGVLIWDGQEFRFEALEKASITVVTERSYGADDNTRELWVDRQISQGDLSLERILAALSHRRDGSFDRPSIYIEEVGYGTRSTTVVGAHDVPVFRHGIGRPPEQSWTDDSQAFAELLTLP